MGPRQLLIVWLALALPGCPSREPEAPAAERTAFTVYAVSYPLAYFAERTAPAGVEVVFPVPPDADPAYWRPSPETIVAFQQADLILLNGAGYAQWTKTATLPKSRTIVTADGCRDAFLETETTGVHRHGPEGEHSHSDTAFTTWLDLGLATCQARHVADALEHALPAYAEEIRSAFKILQEDLRALDAELREVGKALDGTQLFASHPVYQYLGDAYGLTIRSFHFEPEQSLGPSLLSSVDAAKKSRDASIMLWEAEPLPDTREALAARGIEVVVFDPVGNRSPRGGFLDVMRKNVSALRCGAVPESCP